MHVQFLGENLGLLIVLLSCQICFHLNGVDELLVESKPQLFIQKILKSAGYGLLFAAGLFYVFPRLSPGYAAATASACVLIFGLVVLRPIARPFLRAGQTEETVIVGPEPVARKLYGEIMNSDSAGMLRVLDYPSARELARCGTVARIVVVDREIERDNDAAQLLIDLKLRGIRIENAVDSFERVTRKISIEGLSPDRLIFANGFCPSKSYLFLKRLIDVSLSGVALVFAAPVMVLIAILIKLETAGPAIFSQERIGLLGRKITVHKFRSMRQDAERHTGPVWAKENDDRVTRLGAILRKCRLDELPQLWNVLRGDMSLIGPRPERPYFVDLLRSNIRYYDLRHYAKPGITGWAQVMYPYGASIEDAHHKLEYDLYYAKNISARLDLLILLKTIGVVIRGQGR
jgi:exopolysaccharide biosynthesis polyprenyl glycosylphosphotransferase